MVIAIKNFIKKKFEPFEKKFEPLYRAYNYILDIYKGIKRSIKIEVDHAERVLCENLKKIPPYVRDLIVRASKTSEYAEFILFSTEVYVMVTCMALTTYINAVALTIIYTLFGFYVTYKELLFLFFIINACPLAMNISLVVFPYIKSRVVKYPGYTKYIPHAFEQYKPELNKGIDFVVNSINSRYVVIFIDKFKELLKGYPSLKGPKKADRVPLLSGKYIYFSYLLIFILITTLSYIYANVLLSVFVITSMLVLMPSLLL